MLGEDHPLFTLPGVGVAYKFVEQLFSEMGRTDVDQFLDLAALGIVADVAAIVITSYSIHYTKLYEWIFPCRWKSSGSIYGKKMGCAVIIWNILINIRNNFV